MTPLTHFQFEFYPPDFVCKLSTIYLYLFFVFLLVFVFLCFYLYLSFFTSLTQFEWKAVKYPDLKMSGEYFFIGSEYGDDGSFDKLTQS